MSYEKYAEACPVCNESFCQGGCTATEDDPARRNRELALAAVIDELLAGEYPSRVGASELTEDGRIEVITDELPARRFFVRVEEVLDEPDQEGRT